jgi:hypothetical protein
MGLKIRVFIRMQEKYIRISSSQSTAVRWYTALATWAAKCRASALVLALLGLLAASSFASGEEEEERVHGRLVVVFCSENSMASGRKKG